MPKNKDFFDPPRPDKKLVNGKNGSPKGSEQKPDVQAIEKEVVKAMTRLKEGLRELTQGGRKPAVRAYIEVVIENYRRAGNKSQDVVLWEAEAESGRDAVEDRSLLTPLINEVMTRLHAVGRDVLYMSEVANGVEVWYGKDKCDVRFARKEGNKTQLIITPR